MANPQITKSDCYGGLVFERPDGIFLNVWNVATTPLFRRSNSHASLMSRRKGRKQELTSDTYASQVDNDVFRKRSIFLGC